jgi:3-oxoacyl-[acyl-carrier protein] reductase
MDDTQRVVVITGGSKGIGRAVALRFAEEKPQIFLVHYDHDDSAAHEACVTLADRGVEVESYRIDVSSFKDVEALFKEILSKAEKVDVLVNNAGITRDTLLMRMSEDEWDSVIRVNMKSVFNCTQAVIRSMLKKRNGCIINISSVVGLTGNAGQTNYCASKAGILGFTKSIAREVAVRGVTVNAVAPGFIDTEMTASLPEKAKEAFLEQIPLKRVGRPEDVAEAVYWLSSPSAGYITGQTIHVNGGLFMS